MQIGFDTIQLNTGERPEFMDITKRVRDCLLKHPIRLADLDGPRERSIQVQIVGE